LRIAAAACLAATLVLSAVAVLRRAPEAGNGVRMKTYASFGETLLHGLRAEPGDVSYRMPLATLYSARLQYHAGLPPKALLAAHQAALVILVFALGCLLHPYGGLFSAAVALVLMREGRFDLYPESGYRLLFLMTACLLVWRARAPSLGRTVLLALAVGTTLLYRTPLAFFPFVLALHEWAVRRRAAPDGLRRQLAVLCVVPYLFLLPWVAMNRSVHGRFILFEKDAATANIVTGALGLVRSVEGDLSTLVDEPIDLGRSGAVVGWAARQILRHPLRYASAYGRRAAFAASRYPVLLVLAVFSVYHFRRRREFRQLGLLAAYFLAIHCLMSVEDAYFEPLEPVFAVLAGALVFGFRETAPPPADSIGYRLSALAVNAMLGLVLALSAHAGWVVGAFALLEGPGDPVRDLDRAVSANPGDSWLLLKRGRERLARGETAGAVEDLRAAAAAEPGEAAVGLRLAWARALAGDPAPLLGWSPPPREGNDDPLQLRLDAEVLKACALIREGRGREAEARVRSALELHEERNILVRGDHGEREREALEKLRSSETGFRRQCEDLQGARPAAEKRALRAILDRLLPASRPRPS